MPKKTFSFAKTHAKAPNRRKRASKPVKATLVASTPRTSTDGAVSRDEWGTIAASIAIVGMRLQSLANQRVHWAEKYRLLAQQRRDAWLWLRRYIGTCPFQRGESIEVLITRCGKKRMDSDNLAISAKAVRDGIADWLGCDDGSPWIRWTYAQELGDYGVRIVIRRT